ncbi:MAG: RagB/SusD family nutrient uptake outer membrane protein [Bacteroidales bacterium]|nr:RagB/SusD family nutrient uptake outer membrane protein [Bacteroidales bacterium]MDD2264157.1 RagB/SusD family nutrient uptake outer membrane protein [Bacteroidales bacterium]MDD2831372.1 RagB/SusD family nutrient uptake outer membrane protein [Bacteroidales bacterium]MDD3208366.1 RagB/SusD family nutrient uptake outer membrane protein [Bacteroidales bacterium]MDD3696951.1 RagB/SusD family nutrient uptake outer membrane protein [Bacteroidales bacterium]
MKKRLLLLLILIITSCNLDKFPDGSISSEQALQSVDDVLRFRADMYLNIRDYLSSGFPIYSTEIMSDSFHASITFGNRNGEYYKWEVTPIFGYIESLWNYAYYCVTLANFLEDGISRLLQTELTEGEKAQLEIVFGEAAFLKAFSMFKCVQLYCKSYDPSTASSDLGLILINESVHNPNDIASYAGRSSLEETYTYIEQNLVIAEEKLATVEGNVGSIYLTKDAVTAFKARVALAKCDFNTAIAASTSLISCGKYPLIDNVVDFKELWTNDSGKECIIQYWADYIKGSIPNSNNYGYIGEMSNGGYSPNYIPEKWIIDAFSTDDIRFQTWFRKIDVTFGTITGNVYILFKYPGNPALRSESAGISNYINRIKDFRIAEQYLIAAESHALRNTSSDISKACEYLNALRSKRIIGYTDHNYSGDELMEQIKMERAKELFAEGFRFTDLKRWNKGFSRSEAQDKNIITSAGGSNTELLKKDSNNYGWLWPVPQAEIDSNPQIRGQQNPGY